MCPCISAWRMQARAEPSITDSGALEVCSDRPAPAHAHSLPFRRSARVAWQSPSRRRGTGADLCLKTAGPPPPLPRLRSHTAAAACRQCQRGFNANAASYYCVLGAVPVGDDGRSRPRASPPAIFNSCGATSQPPPCHPIQWQSSVGRGRPRRF